MRKDKKADECLKMYNEGKTLQEIGDHFGDSKENIRQLLSSRPGYKATWQRPGKEEFKKSILESKKILGWTNIIFAQKMNVSPNTANNWLHGVNMPFEPKKSQILKVLADAIAEKEILPEDCDSMGFGREP
jgi:hypothetical protein